MEQFTFKFTITAKDNETAVKVMQALQKLAKSADVEDLVKVANAVEKNPKLIKKAINFL